ncbi:epimerase, partial [Rhizobiaceae sp. 2RAB30]
MQSAAIKAPTQNDTGGGKAMSLPTRFDDVEQLDDFLTQPSDALIEDLARLDGDIMLLGVGGKMGPTLAKLAR